MGQEQSSDLDGDQQEEEETFVFDWQHGPLPSIVNPELYQDKFKNDKEKRQHSQKWLKITKSKIDEFEAEATPGGISKDGWEGKCALIVLD